MTVGTVSLYKYSGEYNYDTTNQYRFFGTLIPSDRLNDLMVKYHILQTGDSYKDLHNLYLAIKNKAAIDSSAAAKTGSNRNVQNIQQTAQENQIQAANLIPWATLMGQVGLIASGDLAIDYGAFKTRLYTMQISAKDNAQKANIGLLMAQAEIVFVDNTQQTAKAASSQAKIPQSAPKVQTSGADIQAAINKLYLNM